MRRGVALVSAAITAFTAVILASVVYGYRVAAAARPSSPQADVQSIVSDPGALPAPGQTKDLGPRDAATLAGKFINRTDAYSVELTMYGGIQAYKVTFLSGELVYISLSGQVLGTIPPPTTVGNPGGNGGGHGNGSGGGREDGSGDGHESSGGTAGDDRD